MYTLKSGPVEPGPVLTQSVGVELPLSEASLDTERIAITPSPYERDYLADGQWPERLPKIVQEVLLESLSMRWGGTYVGRTGSGFQVNNLLLTEIQDFSVYDLNTDIPEVRLKVSFKILSLRTRKVIAGQTFDVTEKVCLKSMKGIVEAFNTGLHVLLQQSTPWMERALLKESAPHISKTKPSRSGS